MFLTKILSSERLLYPKTWKWQESYTKAFPKQNDPTLKSPLHESSVTSTGLHLQTDTATKSL